MQQIIEEHEGTVGEFIGDGIMSFWNSPDDVSVWLFETEREREKKRETERQRERETEKETETERERERARERKREIEKRITENEKKSRKEFIFVPIHSCLSFKKTNKHNHKNTHKQDHATKAVQAAVAMQDRLLELNEVWKETLDPDFPEVK